MSVEDVAERVFKRAGISPNGPDGTAHLAVALLGKGSLAYADQEPIARVVDNPPGIFIGLGLRDTELTLAIAMGVSIWWLREHPEDALHASPECLAICLAVPMSALIDAADRLDRSVDAIAEEFVVSADAVRLRMRSLPSRSYASGVREIAS